MGPLGDHLVGIVRAARQDCLLAAPYIKYGALARILDACPGGCFVRVVTRWRIDEIAMGVSDLEVWDLLVQRGYTELWLKPNLHAKYYRADDRVALGSANLTDSALGWKPLSNLEILHDMGEAFAGRALFEEQLFDSAVKVDPGLYSSFQEALEAFPPPPPSPPALEVPFSSLTKWQPAMRFPDELYEFYVGNGDALTGAARRAAAFDLAALQPPPGLNEVAFNSWVKVAVLQTAAFRAIDRFVISSRRFGEMRDFIEQLGANDGSREWQTWMRWIVQFLPDHFAFHTANYSEIVSRR